MSAHTPGPWRVVVKHAAGIVTVEGEEPIAEVFSEATPRRRILADARLIAAAPDLLAALERIADPSDYGPDGGWDAASYPDEIARAAIAKARGQ